MRHDKTPFIKMAKADGQFVSVIGNKLKGPAGWVTPKGGTHVRQGEGWLTYYEDLNADVQVYVEGSQVQAVVKTTGNDQYHKTDVYRLDGKTITATLLIRATGYFTDGTMDYLPIQGTLICDGTAQTFTAQVPTGKTCYRLDVQGIDLTPDDMANYAYRQANITLTNHGWTLEAHAYVGPAGALNKAQATVSKTNPKYGEQIIFQAIETHPDEWRFSHWGTDVTNKDNPLYVTASPDTVNQTAMFADASKIVDFSIKAYVENGRVKAEVKTLQNRSNQFVVVSFDIYYTYHGETASVRYSREVILNGQVSAYVFQDTQAEEVNYLDNMDIPLLNPWVLGQVETEIGQPTVFMRDSLAAGYSSWSVTADDDDITTE